MTILPHGAYIDATSFDLAKQIDLPTFRLSPRFLREKRWCYFGVINEEFILGSAIVHLGYISNAFVFVYDKKNDTLIENNFICPPRGQISFDRDPFQGVCRLNCSAGSIDMINDLDNNLRQLKIDVREGSARQITAEFEIEDSHNNQSLRLFTPMSDGGTVFTNKIAGLRAKGKLSINNNNFEANAENSFAIVDWTDGFHNRITEWNWASAGGKSECGKDIGINFSRGVYTSGLNENFVWINGEAHNQTEIVFNYNKEKPSSEPWFIKDESGMVNLTFEPSGKRSANDDFGLVSSYFTQAFGSFTGEIKTQSGETIALKNLGGVVEDHYAKW